MSKNISLLSFPGSCEQFDTKRALLTTDHSKVGPETERELFHAACFGIVLLHADSSDGVARSYRCPGIIE